MDCQKVETETANSDDEKLKNKISKRAAHKNHFPPDVCKFLFFEEQQRRITTNWQTGNHNKNGNIIITTLQPTTITWKCTRIQTLVRPKKPDDLKSDQESEFCLQ